MRRLFIAMFFVIIGIAITTFAFQYHVVHTTDGPLVVRKSTATTNDIYVDVRKMNAAEWQKHPKLIEAMETAGHGKYIVKPKPVNPVRNFLGNLKRGFTGKSNDAQQ